MTKLQNASKLLITISLVITSSNTLTAAEISSIECSSPAIDLGHSPKPRGPIAIGGSVMQPGQVSTTCTTIANKNISSANCYSQSAEAFDLEQRAGWKCEKQIPCGDGASFSNITVTEETLNSAATYKACATLRNTTPRSKRLFINLITTQ